MALAPAAVSLRYLQGYPQDTQDQVLEMFAAQRASDWLLAKYPKSHGLRTDRALYTYAQDLKQSALRSTEPISKVAYDSH